MINITFPDGSVRQYESGVSAFDIANSISPRLAADVLAATVIPAADTTGKGSVYDVTRPINEDATIELEIAVEEIVASNQEAPSSYSYNVAPMFGVGDKKVKIEELAKAVSFRLPIHSTETKDFAKVYHNGVLMGTYEIKEENGEKFVEISSDAFSTFTIEPSAHALAEINGQKYETLLGALAAAQAGDTIKLLGNAILEDGITIAKSITIDGNGFALISATNGVYNSALMLGDSGWGDDHGETIVLKNLEISGWNTKLGVIRAQGITLVMESCVLTNNSVSNDAYGVVSLNYTDATIWGCKFEGNTSKVVDVNYNADSSKSVVTIEGCEFVGNSSTGAGIIYRNAGEKLTIKDTKFTNNTVSTNGNAATVYLGWGAGHEIIGCTFDGNSVVTSHATTKRFASAIFADGCKIEGNIFLNNSATRNGEAISTVVAIGAYYGAADISGNYWVDGSKPVKGEVYTVEYTRQECALDSYYTSYENGELGGFVEIPKIIEVGTLEELINALKADNNLPIIITATITLSNSSVLRRTISICPTVIGSKLPGTTASVFTCFILLPLCL